MSVYRTPKNKNFTVVDNHYLKNPDLSLKAKGLMTLLLSLPDQWDFSITGLATLSKDQVCAVRSAIHTTQIQNTKQYLRTALFNAPATIDNYYAARVNHDQAHGPA